MNNDRELLELAAKERQKRQECELMAECMDMVRQDLISLGIIDKSVPPMMLTEAILSAIRSAVFAERDCCAKLCDDISFHLGESVGANNCADAIRSRAKEAA